MTDRRSSSQHAPADDDADEDLPRDPELEAIVRRVAELAADRKAIDPLAIDLRGASAFTDAFLVFTGNTERQVKAIHDAIHDGMKHDGERLLPRRVEGLPEARWILMDYDVVVVHVFVPEAREFYRLEALWGDRPRFDVPRGDEVLPVDAGAAGSPVGDA
ncbi:MAG: ribosome silencing factor [Solirubrobacteraceae bacterium]|nr:ribosome silencing factor [Solirubrobacteraceae bacterium]